ncbi:MAG: hypothetical protein QM808_17725 [Steroidobacteraceae bacterium]
MAQSEFENDSKISGGKSALADLPPAVRTEQQIAADLAMEAEDRELEDPSAILQGAKAIIGKAVYSSNQDARKADQSATQQANEEHHKAEEREMRELMHLAAWNAQMTTVGGVQMTNEQAQQCRQHIIDNADEYADRAVRDGRIKDNQRDEYIWTVKRIKDLEDKKGRGTISDNEDRERDNLKRGAMGQITENDVGQYKKDQLAYSANDTDTSLRRQTTSAVADDSLFQSAPDLTDKFAKANAAIEPLDKKEAPAIAPLSPRVSATGLSI